MHVTVQLVRILRCAQGHSTLVFQILVETVELVQDFEVSVIVVRALPHLQEMYVKLKETSAEEFLVEKGN